MEKVTNNSFLGTEKEGKLLLKFAFPCVLSLIIQSLYNLVDQIFIGHCASLGATGNAATGIVYPITIIALGIGLWLGDGTAAYMSLAQGRRDTKNTAKSVGTALFMGITVSIFMTAVCFLFKDGILQAIGAQGDILAMSSEYANFIFGGLLFFIVASVINPIIRADGCPGYAMVAMTVGAVLNICLDPLFIFVFKMGMTGAAAATFIGQVVAFILNFAYLFKTKTFRLKFKEGILNFKLLGSILKFGVSSFLTQFAIVVISVVNNILLKKYSEACGYDIRITQGVLTLAFKVFGIVVSIIVGIAVGGQPVIGYNFGAGNFSRVKTTMKYILIMTAITGIIATVIFEFFPDLFIYIFGTGGEGVDAEAYKKFTEMTFRIYLGLIFFTCILKVISIFFQSVGQPVKATAIALCRDMIFLVPLALIFCKIGGIDLLLWSAPVTDIMSVILAVSLYIGFYKKVLNEKVLKENAVTKIRNATKIPETK